MKMEWKSYAKVGFNVFWLYLCIIYWPFFAGLVSSFFNASMPLLIGCAAAYIINILMSFCDADCYCCFHYKSGGSGVNPLRRTADKPASRSD